MAAGDITKPLLGVVDVADKGNIIIFTKEGGTVLKDEDLSIYRRAVSEATIKTPFQRKIRSTYYPCGSPSDHRGEPREQEQEEQEEEE